MGLLLDSGARETQSFYLEISLAFVLNVCSMHVAPSDVCWSLKQKLPKVSLFHLASLLTKGCPEKTNYHGSAKATVNGISVCEISVLLEYYIFLIWPLFIVLLMLLFASDSTRK